MIIIIAKNDKDKKCDKFDDGRKRGEDDQKLRGFESQSIEKICPR